MSSDQHPRAGLAEKLPEMPSTPLTKLELGYILTIVVKSTNKYCRKEALSMFMTNRAYTLNNMYLTAPSAFVRLR